MVFIFIICEIGFFISTSLSMPLLFFACKSHFFNLVRFIKKKFFKKEKLFCDYVEIENFKEYMKGGYGKANRKDAYVRETCANCSCNII